MSTPKVGDRVKATCGESVVVGTVTAREAFRASVQADGDEHPRNFSFALWAFEVLVPEIPNAAKTVCTDYMGDAWQYRNGAWSSTSTSDTFETSALLANRWGPLVEMAPVVR